MFPVQYHYSVCCIVAVTTLGGKAPLLRAPQPANTWLRACLYFLHKHMHTYMSLDKTVSSLRLGMVLRLSHYPQYHKEREDTNDGWMGGWMDRWVSG